MWIYLLCGFAFLGVLSLVGLISMVLAPEDEEYDD